MSVTLTSREHEKRSRLQMSLASFVEEQAVPTLNSRAMEDGALHIAMFPWLAFGHILPYLELSKCLAKLGHHISFISTPKNIQRLPKIPPHLGRHIDLVGLPLLHTDNLPDVAESTMDIDLDQMPHLKIAFDSLQGPMAAFLQSATPDWIIYDVISHWMPSIAAEIGVPCAHFSIYPPPAYAFIGPVSKLIDGSRFTTVESLTTVPPWVPFPTSVAFRPHEAMPILNLFRSMGSGVTDFQRYGLALDGCHIIAIRDCLEFGSDWLNLLKDVFQKPVIPIGLLPPSANQSDSEDEPWPDREWLDRQAHGSTACVASGSEVRLSKEQVHELAVGLELSGLPFIWALRTGPNNPEMLPAGFEDRVKGRGVVRRGWVPQLKILAHPSIGGFLSHGGWSSIVEALGQGTPLVLLPLMYDQGLNARMIGDKRLGLEIPRNDDDGSFNGADVARSLRTVMVEAEGELFRSNAKKMKEVFGDYKLHDQYVASFARYLRDHKAHFQVLTSSTHD